MNLKVKSILLEGVFLKRLYVCIVFIFSSLSSNTILAQSVINLSNYNVISSEKENKKSKNNARIINSILKGEQNKFSIIQLPAGKTWIEEPIIIPSGIILEGSVEGSEIIVSPLFKDLNEGFIVNENYKLYTLEKNEQIVLRNFTINGNGIEPDNTGARGVYFNKVYNVAIQNLNVINTSAEGIRIDASNLLQGSGDITIKNCLIQKRGNKNPCIMIRSFTDDGSNTTFIKSMVSNVTIKGNTCIGGGQGVLLFNVSNVNVYNNTCLANAFRGIIAGPTCSDIVIRSNRIDSAGSTGIHFAYYSKNIFIDSNIVSNTLFDMSGKGGEGQGIKAYVGFYKISITNNFCNGNATDGIALEGGGYGQIFTIKGNRCEKNKRNGIRVMAGKLYDNNRGNIENGLIEKNKLINNLQEALYINSDDSGRSRVKNLKARSNTIILKPGQKKYKVSNVAGDVIIRN